MVNLETLKKEVYQKEKKKLFRKFLLFNILSVLVITLSLSTTEVTKREKELMGLYRETIVQRDSLNKFVTNQLVLLKDNENKLVRKSLSISLDTNYVDENINISDLYIYAENQLDIYQNIKNIADIKWDSINSIPNSMPVTLADLYKFSDGFGYRKHPLIKKILFHEGIDLSVTVGSDIFATANGIVEKVISEKKGYGNRIVINHKNGYKTVYAHLSEFKVVVGQKVKKYDLIAISGNTGSTTGPHLHYEVLIKNRPVDPYKYFYINDKTILANK